MGGRQRSLAERLVGSYEVTETGCWEWQRKRNHGGYGSVRVDGHHIGAHRAILISLGVEIPEGMEVDHLCSNPPCINPDHLEVVTPRVNKLRSNSPAGINSRRTECTNGHEFDAANTRIQPNGARRCRECQRIWAHRAYHASRKDAS